VAGLRECREAVIYTPGSAAGVSLNVLQSLDAPAVPFASAEEDLRDEITGVVSGLLGLLRIDADPIQSRESILLSNLIESSWRAGRGLSLESLVPAVADPPFAKLGALPVESVFPRRERQGLVMALNNLLAAPAFENWRKGEPMDVGRLLRAPDGRPRLSIVYTAHLGDEERLFVTALLLDKVKTWMRQQPGTTELRALVYMDEIFGYFPPHPANPPTKRPLLTLLKQARSQGVGVVLATQNPVDIDYKGLANMGTWMVGKLQTDQDRARLRDGLLGAGVDAKALDRLLDATR
jgi:DNA helicase HerA-like ATPase